VSIGGVLGIAKSTIDEMNSVMAAARHGFLGAAPEAA
jgi:hypothetical protein